MSKIAVIVPSEVYGIIIRVNTPILFYWDKDNKFDGMSFEADRELDTGETIAVNRLMELIKPLIGKRR